MRPCPRLTLAASIVALTLAAPSSAPACPTCKQTIADTRTGGGQPDPAATLPGGFNASVYLLLGALFTAAGLVVTTVARAARQVDHSNAAQAPE